MTHFHSVTRENERKTLFVIIFTIITMCAEIIYGYITNSMALLADGYHMGTHAIALSLTYIAYVLIRKFQNSSLFPLGTDKIGTLTAYTSSLFLAFTGFYIIYKSLLRFIHPKNIMFEEAVLVAVIGLIVNAACIFIMEGKHHKHYEHECNHDKNEEKEDYNFKAAYYHILADAITSVLAILALLIGSFYNIVYLDSLIGILGGILILKWSFGLLKNTIKILIDMKK